MVVHDECSSDVNDMNVIETILQPHKNGLPAVVLHCGMHSYRTEGWNKKVATPWMQFTGLISTGHGPQVPIAVKFVDKDHPITKDLGDWTTVNEELYNNASGKLEPTAHALASGTQVYTKDDRRPGRKSLPRPWSPGPTPTTARPGSSPPPSATTTQRSTTPATLTWLPAACSGPSANSTPSISRPCSLREPNAMSRERADKAKAATPSVDAVGRTIFVPNEERTAAGGQPREGTQAEQQ